jgi:hypothetical protein
MKVVMEINIVDIDTVDNPSPPRSSSQLVIMAVAKAVMLGRRVI